MELWSKKPMTVTIDLPEELETELSEEAERLKLSLPEYALRLLETRNIKSNQPKSGADLVSYWQSEGLIGSRPDITDAQEHARKLRKEAEDRTHS
jgi:hypothetical protein